jgi:hypothetical protein
VDTIRKIDNIIVMGKLASISVFLFSIYRLKKTDYKSAITTSSFQDDTMEMSQSKKITFPPPPYTPPADPSPQHLLLLLHRAQLSEWF